MLLLEQIIRVLVFLEQEMVSSATRGDYLSFLEILVFLSFLLIVQ